MIVQERNPMKALRGTPNNAGGVSGVLGVALRCKDLIGKCVIAFCRGVGVPGSISIGFKVTASEQKHFTIRCE